LVLIVVAGVAACGAAAPWGSKARIDRAADEEGALVIYANTGDQESAALLGAFRRAHPAIKVSFQRQNSAELYQRYVADIAAGRPSADLVWSS
ncbi:extracellular solute-binding protein, partial [Serratia marcescens]|uniref:extracellular solute-binding protein n=2 Tax=Pseudomonadota TaxID=1224 RepID=UPI0013DD2289